MSSIPELVLLLYFKTMSLKQFLISKTFFYHLLTILLIGILLIVITLFSIKKYTKHGEEFSLPNYNGLTINEIKQNHLNQGFSFFIIDSVYNQDMEGGTIIAQNPLPGSRVKKGRNIYFTIVAFNPQEVIMPDLIDLSLRQSISLLKSKGLKIGTLNYVDDMAENAVLAQQYQGTEIESGEKLYRGSKIDLTLGRGDKASPTKVPELIGKTRQEATELLHQHSLNVGKEYFLDSNDEKLLKVYKTEPSHYDFNLLFLGEKVNVYYRSVEHFDFEKRLYEARMEMLDTIPTE